MTGSTSNGEGGETNLANHADAAALRYRAQAPKLDGLMKDLGLDGSSLEALAGSAVGTAAPQRVVKPEAD